VSDAPVPSNDCPEPPSLRAAPRTHLLHEACEAAGSVGELALLLGVTTAALTSWLEGEEEAPAGIYQACADIILLHD
jgi:hypothetical protein